MYADGLIDCWGSVDLAIFRRKLEQGWVATGAPVGAQASFHNLGWAKVSACKWEYTPADLLSRVETGIARLNPSRMGLVDLNGEETELRGKVRYAKLGYAEGSPYRAEADGNEIVGHWIPVFLYSNSQVYITPWFIYADGSSRVGAHGNLSTVSEAAKAFDSGELGTSVPDGGTHNHRGFGVIREPEIQLACETEGARSRGF